MLFDVKNNTLSHELEQDIFWHASESKFHLEQFENHLAEARHHYRKYIENHEMHLHLFKKHGGVIHGA